ncbi:spermatogenesis-associated protein 6 isoform X3 [Cygnus olor]|uniref:spermatogenesis-associated protein 6 isoform X3 n=1 Tax=Cygnus olor TaxID=8869 RepID=UPI001ADE70CC|nr:spermatogenesis-associated protein 6 isoform X3 [Cygnus olor]
MARRALRCVLRLEIRAITCPGVQLKDKEELYLSVSLLGQYKKTRCVPAAFPLFFQEKLVFEKTFADIVDPADLVKLLELDMAVLELIQLVPPVGEILATYEENTRDFLFPDPKLTHWHHGLDREILMKRSSSFTDDLNWVHHSTPNGKLQTKLPKKITLSPEKSRHSIVTKNYEQPTVASKSRSPSPYTKRRMCELSEEARQRLAHLNFGPYEFRRETDKPPFVVRRVEQPSPGIELHAWCTLRESTMGAWSKVTHDPSLLGSYKPKRAKAKSTHGKDWNSSSDVCIENVISGPPNGRSHSAGSLVHSAPSAFRKHSPSSVLNRSSLRERFNSGCPPPANGDEIHKRVKNILRTHSARQRLVFNESNSSQGDLTKTRDSSHKAHLSMSELQSSSPVQRNTTVHLDNGEYWSSRAAVYKGKSHRAIFEDSLEKIYRNMYRKASGTVSDQKPHS